MNTANAADLNPSNTWTAVIIGSGFGGQSAALMLRRMGIDDFVILERREFVGGTWCQNRYPGAAVDVQSPLYSIASEPWPWTRMYAHRDELEQYTNHVLTRHGLRERTITGANVVEARWHDAEGVWRVATDSAGVWTGRFLINASGPLSMAKIPDFPGRDTFAGSAFHTNAWDPCIDLAGKRVAIVGSGASAAQVIPAITPEVAQLHVFQRTPHWVLPRPDREFGPTAQALLRFEPAYRLLRWSIYWKLETRVIGFKYSRRALELIARREALQHLKRQVPDPALRAALTPDYTIGCKRIILSNTLYPALSQPHVTLHDRTDAIAAVVPQGIRTTGGTTLELDAIIWATGYDATVAPMTHTIVGRDGRSLADVWTEFPRAYLGTTVPGFPNCFLMTGPNTGIGHTSALFIIESQLEYVRRAIEAAQRRGPIDVTPAAEERWTASVHQQMEQTVWAAGGCNSWYRHPSGRVIAMYPGFSFEFRLKARAFRAGDHGFG